ncbi:MAG TPA: hypothetical protein VFT06_13505, partial [Flavisolibacter sp.]|nr:hypothetical protein [Flavisolibacter sp.]
MLLFLKMNNLITPNSPQRPAQAEKASLLTGNTFAFGKLPDKWRRGKAGVAESAGGVVLLLYRFPQSLPQ